MIELCEINNLELAKDFSNFYYTSMFNRVIEENIQSLEFKYDFEISKFIKSTRDINELISTNYHNEAIIKSSFIKDVLSKYINNVVSLELKVGNSRIDICKFNGLSIGYEIKTEYDTFTRLKKQLVDYSKVFDKLYLILPYDKIETSYKYISDNIGVYAYRIVNGVPIFKCVRKANIIRDKDFDTLLNILSVNELKKNYNFKRNTNKKTIITNIINDFSSNSINKIFLDCMSKRYSRQWIVIFNNLSNILNIDLQWFFKNSIDPIMHYKKGLEN